MRFEHGHRQGQIGTDLTLRCYSGANDRLTARWLGGVERDGLTGGETDCAGRSSYSEQDGDQ